MKFFLSRLLWMILTIVIALLFIVLIVATVVCNLNFNAVNMAFGSPSTTVPVESGGDESDTEYYKSDYGDDVNGQVLLEEDQKIIEEVVGEAATLLWNNGALPLAKGSKVSPFNKASADIVETGSGSGYIATNANLSATLKSALERKGVDISVNPSLWNFLRNNSHTRTTRGGQCTEWQNLDVNEIPWSEYNGTALSEVATYNDAAIITIARTGGEYADARNQGGNDNLQNGTYTAPSSSQQRRDYLEITQAEYDTITNVLQMKKDGIVKSVILLLNSGNQIEFDFLAEFMDDIDAAMWIGQPGMFGMNAVADILVGNINPSGHLPDTWAYLNTSAPSTANDGPKYNGDTSSTYTGNSTGIGADPTQKNRYMVYQEGIYVGYKYYETRYEDLVLGNGNADSEKGVVHGSGTWNYDDEVVFPFGHGESYTSFAYSAFTASKNMDGGYDVHVKVTNNGEVAGKDAVQIYLQKPYTQYSIDYNLEKAAVELVGYTKTKLLQPGESQDVTVVVDNKELLTYDNENKLHYILDGGDFYFTVGENAHDAVNNILKAKGADVEGNTNLTKMITLDSDYTSYIMSPYNEDVEVTNQLDHGDINKYANKGDNSVTYLSRGDWDATYPMGVAPLSFTEGLINDLQYGNASGQNGYTLSEDRFLDMPQYGKVYYKNTNEWIAANGLMPKFDADGEQIGDFVLDDEGNPVVQKWTVAFLMLNYEDFAEEGTIGWDSEWWDIILDQMTWEEQAYLCANAYHKTMGCESIALPDTSEENGPVGITQRSDFTFPGAEDWTWVSYPNAPLMGATFNTELVEREGMHKSEDMLYTGYSGIYGPGANLHRTAYGGRNWEYASECEFLAGKTCAAEAKGIQNKGAMAFVKHFCFNDLETSRRHISTWSNEQASREIYLKAFEYVFTEGGALATMNSFTRVGPYWCGADSALTRNILRDEWGFKGMNITDWDSGGSMNKYDAMLGGTDSWDGNGDSNTFNTWKEDPAFNVCMREATKHMIYAIMHTNGMNGYGADTKLRTILVWWQIMFIALDVVFGVLTVICLTMLIISCIFRKKIRSRGQSMNR